MVSQEIIDGLNLARDIMQTSDSSVVVIKNSQILTKKKGDGIRPLLEAIEEVGEQMQGCIIGDRILGKASALLCRYAEVSAVYSPQGTKTAIALLIIGGVPSQIEQMIPYITNRTGDGMCPFEKMLENTTEPEEAYEILTEKLMRK
jgi:hypothetical protein